MNAAGFPILSLVTFLPLAGCALILLVRGDEAVVATNARWTALWTSLIVFAISLILWFRFDTSDPGFQFVEQASWLPEFGVGYHMGVDGISVLFVLLTTALTPICIVASWDAIGTRVREYMLAFLVAETMMVGLFVSLDFVMFYIFYEGVLLPVFILMGVWGGPRRVYAGIKFFLYTFAGSVLMLAALLAMWVQAGTTDIPTLLHTHFPASMQTWLFLALLASFAVKVPLWPLHTWLPDAYAEAPTATTVILAAILSKMGAYGFLRFSVPMLPQATQLFAPLMFALAVIAVVYAAITALAQTDMKRLIGYSSISHMGLIVIGIFTVDVQGLDGALFQMLAHGVITAALFLCIGMLWERTGSREIGRERALADRMPLYAVVFMVFTLANVGLPGTAGFVGEFLVLVGATEVNIWLGLFGGAGMILAVVYALVLYRRMGFGVAREALSSGLASLRDLGAREIALLAPLVVLVFWMGIYPSSFTRFFDASVGALAQQHVAALARPDRTASAVPLRLANAAALPGERP